MADTITMTSGNKCTAIVKNAIPNATQGTLDAITSAMEVELKYAPPGMDPQKALENAVKQISDRMQRNIKIRKYQEFMNLTATKRVKDYIANNFADDPFAGLEAKMMGINSDITASRMSAQVQQRELFESYMSGFVADLTDANLLDRIHHADGDFERLIANELERIGQENVLPDTGNKDAKAIAGIIHKWQEKARLDANDAGAWIGDLPGYIVRQSHDMFRVREMGRDAWKNAIRDRLDWERIERSAGEIVKDKEKYLNSLFDSIQSGQHLKNSTPSASKLAPGSIAKSVSHERVLHFKPGQWFDYNLEAGSRSIMEAVIFGFDKNAMTTGLMRTFGPSALDNMDKINADLKRKHTGQSMGNKYEYFQKELSGESRIPGNATVAKWWSNIRGVQSMVMLGESVITAGLTDPFMLATELRYQGAPAFKGYGVALASDLKSVSSKERVAVAKSLGVMMQGMSNYFQNRLDSNGLMSGTMSSIMSAYFKLNLLTPHTDRLRMGAAEAMSSMAAAYADDAFDALPKKFQRVMNIFGIDATDWEILRAKGVETAPDGATFMTPEAILKISDGDIRSAYGADLSDYKVRNIRRDLGSKFHSYLIDRVDAAVLRPDAKTEAYKNMGTKAGTLPGELLRSVMHLKGFPIAFLQRVVGRELYGSGAKTLGEALTRPDVLGNMAWLMTQSTLLGYGVMAAKDALHGKEPANIMSDGVLREAALRGGGLGFYGDVLFGELKKEWGRGLISSVAGPTANTIDDIGTLIGGLRDGDLKAANAVKTIWRHAVPNLFYTKPVTDYAILYQILEGLEPGTMRKMERRFRSEHDREYWLSPVEMTQ